MKFGLKHYWKPTPLKMRKLGDSIAVACGSISGLAYIGQAPTFGSIAKYRLVFRTEDAGTTWLGNLAYTY